MAAWQFRFHYPAKAFLSSRLVSAEPDVAKEQAEEVQRNHGDGGPYGAAALPIQGGGVALIAKAKVGFALGVGDAADIIAFHARSSGPTFASAIQEFQPEPPLLVGVTSRVAPAFVNDTDQVFVTVAGVGFIRKSDKATKPSNRVAIIFITF